MAGMGQESRKRHANCRHEWTWLNSIVRTFCGLGRWFSIAAARLALYFSFSQNGREQTGLWAKRVRKKDRAEKRKGSIGNERIKWRRYNKEFYDCQEGQPSKSTTVSDKASRHQRESEFLFPKGRPLNKRKGLLKRNKDLAWLFKWRSKEEEREKQNRTEKLLCSSVLHQGSSDLRCNQLCYACYLNDMASRHYYFYTNQTTTK